MQTTAARRDRSLDGKVSCFTIAQAAQITGVSQKNINTYLDRELAFASAIGGGFRAVRQDALIAVKLNFEFSQSLMLPTRLELIKQAMANPRCKYVNLSDNHVVRVDVARSFVNAGIAKLRAAKSAIAISDDILSGEPCIKGTRISAYLVNEIVDECGMDEVRSTYPHLTDPEIEAARIYAAAFPRRGRPRSVESRLEKTKPTRSRVVRVKARP